MQEFNKATAAVVAGAIAAVAGALSTLDPELIGAIQTLLTAALVWLVPNRAGPS